MSLYADHVIVICRSAQRRHRAGDEPVVAEGFQSWLEAAPPGPPARPGDRAARRRRHHRARRAQRGDDLVRAQRLRLRHVGLADPGDPARARPQQRRARAAAARGGGRLGADAADHRCADQPLGRRPRWSAARPRSGCSGSAARRSGPACCPRCRSPRSGCSSTASARVVGRRDERRGCRRRARASAARSCRASTPGSASARWSAPASARPTVALGVRMTAHLLADAWSRCWAVVQLTTGASCRAAPSRSRSTAADRRAAWRAWLEPRTLMIG